MAAALTIGGCGGAGDGDATATPPRATLLLDFTPNAVHAGIYSAAARAAGGPQGVRLTIREPADSTDAVKLLLAGKVEFAVLDIHDLAIARARGSDLVGVFALVQRPLAAVLAQPDVRTPRGLEGRAAGVTGLPSDDAVLRSVVAGAGGDPARVRRVTIGFNAVPALLSGKVAGVTAFWNVEGVALRRKRPGFREFRVDDFGAPAYPELVVTVTGRTLREHRGLVDRVRAALRRGYSFTLSHPRASLADLAARNPGLDRALLAAELRALRPVLTLHGPPGELDPARLRAWARWEQRFGIVRRRPDVERMFLLSR